LATAVGQPAPEFKLAELDHPETTLTKASFKGKYLLVDFWGTWCGWCVAELPNTHKAYATYRGKGLEILSLASDKSPEDVRKFRQKPGMPMPWRHAFIGTGKDLDPVVKAYGVSGFPSLFLIGPDGTVLARGMDLRMEAFEKTLAKFLK
jgi:thiol-disulfide isomerase/thioredoxin